MTLQFCKTRSCLQRTLERVGVWEVHARDNHRQLVISRGNLRRTLLQRRQPRLSILSFALVNPGAVNAAHYV